MGRYLLLVAERLGRACAGRLAGVVLTHQTVNARALRLYARCGYTLDPFSPCAVDPLAGEGEGAGWEKYSKYWWGESGKNGESGEGGEGGKEVEALRARAAAARLRACAERVGAGRARGAERATCY